MMRQFQPGPLPDNPVDAASAFMAFHLKAARTLLSQRDCTAIAIVLMPAAHEHRDWRLALARDLAREAAPKRVNVVAGEASAALDAAIRFLADAPGVTGQYLPCHE